MKKAPFLTLFLFLYLFCSGQWSWQNPDPQGNGLRDVQFVTEYVGWAVGECGTIIKSVNGGYLWQNQSLEGCFNLLAVSFPDVMNGFALGGGCEMAMACDFIYATKNALFGQPEVNLGLIPGFGGTQRLMRYVGVARSRELIYTGRNIKIDEAKEIGLVQKVFENKEDMMNAAMETLSVIASKSPLIISKCKEVIRKGEAMDIAAGLEVEKEGFKFVFSTEDKAEGVKAFLEKRKPLFQGK